VQKGRAETTRKTAEQLATGRSLAATVPVMSTHDELLREIGARLREARENRNLTHRDLWRTTRIPVAILDAIERYDRARLPQSFYVREFVQTYAAEVGLDPASIADYLAAVRSECLADSPKRSAAAAAPSGRHALYLTRARSMRVRRV
jgi:hypothetical protein